MSGIKFYCLDTETTGLKCNWNEITQICAIRVEDRLQFDKEIRADYPERAQAAALEITGKTHDDLRNGVDKKYAIEAFEKYLDLDGAKPNGRCIIAHNASFDRRFMQDLWAQHGKTFPADLWIDTIPMVKAFGKKQGLVKVAAKLDDSLTLVKVAKRAKGVHNAVSDARNLYYLWSKLIETEDYLDYIKNFPHELNDNCEDSY